MKKPASPEAKHDQLAAKLRHLILDIEVAMITTVTPDGALRSRPMFTLQADEEGELWFLLSDISGEAGDLADEHAVNISYADPAHDRYVSVSGQASIVHDTAKVQELWRSSLKRFFPLGTDDPHLALLQVRIESAEYWDHAASKMKTVHDPRNHDGGAEPIEHAKVDIRATRATG